MLKPNASEEQVRAASDQSRKLSAVGFFLSWVAMYALFDLRHGTIPEFGWRDFIFLMPMVFVSNLLSELLWWLAAAWVGRFDLVGTLEAMREPVAHPGVISQFMGAWADNELVLDILSVLSRVVTFSALYLALGPSIGIL